MRDLADRLGLGVGRRLGEPADEAPRLGGGDVLAEARDERPVARRGLARHPVGLGHQLAERLGELGVVGGRVAEDHPAGDPAEGLVPRVPAELAALAARPASSASASSPATATKRSPSRCSGPPGVEHRLGERAPLPPRLAARDRQRVGLEGDHPVALRLRVRRERVGRALERPVDVGGREQQQRRVADHPHPDRARRRGRGACPRQQPDRLAVDVRRVAAGDRPAAAPEDALERVRDDHRAR